MPTFEFKCEVCGQWGSDWRQEKAPRFCSKSCRVIGTAGEKLKPTTHVVSDQAHKAIEKMYQNGTGRGEVSAMAKRLNLPRWKVTRYAQQQGWCNIGKRQPPWSDAELDILKRHSRHCEEYIRKMLKKEGYERTVAGIVLKRKRMRLSNQYQDGYSANALAMCMGIDAKVITTAIKKGLLKANKRRTNRTEKQGGDIYYIRDLNVKRWIVDNANRIDITKVDKFWFIDLLAG